MSIELFSLLGFCLAAYSIVANDAIQTLGTFLASNSKRSWVVLWAFAASIVVAVMLYGYYGNGGDVAFGRLNKIPFPDGGVQWWHAVPPLALLILTRFGIPVSTTFLVLTLFALSGGAATEGVMEKMLIKSALGYAVAFAAGGVLYLLIARSFERWVANTRDQALSPLWVVAQWLSTGFLWSQWLMQDLANIFVFLPRETVVDASGAISVSVDPLLASAATAVIVGLMAVVFARRGGEIQKIVLSKINTTDIRAATVVDFVYAIILWYFKGVSDIPMSTTWVFLGLLAGRELAINAVTNLRDSSEAYKDVAADAGRAFLGLVVSVVLAFGLPYLALS